MNKVSELGRYSRDECFSFPMLLVFRLGLWVMKIIIYYASWFSSNFVLKRVIVFAVAVFAVAKGHWVSQSSCLRCNKYMHGQPDHECILLFIYGNSKQWLCGMLRPKLVFCATEFFFFNETSIPLAFLWAATVFLSFFLVKQNLTVLHFATFFPYYFWSVLMALKTNLLLLPAWVKMAWLHTKIKYIIKKKRKK